MGYFDGLINSSFKKDSSGRTVFYPLGAVGKGRILENAETESGLRAFLKRYYIGAFLSLAIVPILTGRNYTFLLLIPPLYIWYYYRAGKLSAQCPISEEKLGLKDIYTAMAAANSEFTLWLLLMTSLLIGAAGIWAALRFVPLSHRLIGGAAALFSAAACAVIIYMITAKDEHRNDHN